MFDIFPPQMGRGEYFYRYPAPSTYLTFGNLVPAPSRSSELDQFDSNDPALRGGGGLIFWLSAMIAPHYFLLTSGI